METATDLVSDLEKKLQSVNTLSELESLETDYLGRSGLLNGLLSQMKSLTSEEKKKLGQDINSAKNSIQSMFLNKRNELSNKADSEEKIDVTLPGNPYPQGSLHLVSYAVEEISSIFQKIGFIRMTYPEVEWEYYSFEALNMPKGHPARDDFETFFIDVPKDEKFGKMILTPHTSSGQIREMERLGKPPIRMINIAKCYRPNWDVSHTPMFHQFEGLCVDENITISNLKGTISYFAKQFFGEDREIRLRPYHFQFTEPSFEIDVTCGICKGTGIVGESKCKLCKSGWLELGGSGMTHPNVLRAGGIDPKKYSGWAFGFGVERVIMMKQGLNLDDLRIFYSGDIRFLKQF